MYEVYEEDDALIAALVLPRPCAIRVELHDEMVILHVGPRDWSWNRKTGELIGAGTEITPQPDESTEDHSQ